MDRLSELKDPSSSKRDIEAATSLIDPLEQPASGFMTAFFDEVGRIKAKMATIRRNIKLIEQKHQAALSAISADSAKEISEEIDDLTEQTGRLGQEVRKQLKDMEQRQQQSPAAKNSSEDRIQRNMQSTLSRKFVEVMGEYQEVQSKYKDKYKEQVVRQCKIVNPNASAEEIDAVLESGQPVFQQAVFSAGQQSALNALADIQEKHQDILKLEKSLQELHQLFVDMAILIESQGELLNQIEHSVEQTVSHVEKGVQELAKANEYQKSARKKMCIIICCLTVLFAVILFSVLGKMGFLKTGT